MNAELMSTSAIREALVNNLELEAQKYPHGSIHIAVAQEALDALDGMVLVPIADLRKALSIAEVPDNLMLDAMEDLYKDHPAALRRLAECIAASQEQGK